MKKILIGVFLLITLLIFGIALVPILVPMDVVASEVKTLVKEKTGRDINFSNIEVSFWPNIGLDLQDVTFSNPVWAVEKNMFSLSKLEVSLALKPLLDKKVEVKKIIFIDPSINFEVNTNGKKSWIFSKKIKEKSFKKNKVVDKTGTSIPKDLQFKFSKFNIKNGKFNFFDHKTEASNKLSNINVTISLPNLKSSLNLSGEASYRGENTKIELFIKDPLGFIAGVVSPGSIDLQSKYISFKGSGSMAIAGEMLNGDIESKISSLSGLLSWLGKSKVKKLPFKKLSFLSALKISKTDLVFKDAFLELDEIKAKGDVNIGFSEKPDIFARLSLGELNLDRFINISSKDKSLQKTKIKSKKINNWDKTPIDFTELNSVNLDLILKTKGFSLKGINVGKSDIAVTLIDKKLHFQSSEAKLFGGKFDSNFLLDTSQSKPVLDLSFNVKNVDAKPILTSFANFNKLNGLASGKISLHSLGNNQKEIVGNLSGKGAVVFKNGSFEGIDLLKISKLLQNRNPNVSLGAGKTEFASLGGDFKVKKGIFTNNNLRMKAPMLRASGKGSVNLLKKYINYKLIPVLAISSNIQDSSNMSVPINIKGYFSNIKIKPDFASAIRKIVANPVESAKSLKEIKTNIKKQIKTLKKDPFKALKNIFGGGFFGGSKN